jgi:hypothetical protein
MNKYVIRAVAFALLECAFPSSGMAVDLNDTVQLHGYGHVGYLATDANRYLNADSTGSGDYKDFALLLTGKLSDRSHAWLQLYNIYDKTRLDWAFVDYQVANGPTLRLGQIKMPVGLNNETRDIEYSRPFSMNPFLYQEASEVAHESYLGTGMTYDHDVGSGNFSWDAYVGHGVDYQLKDHHHNGLAGARLTGIAVAATPDDERKFELEGVG